MYELHPNFINPHNEAVHNIARRLSVVQASEDERNQIKPWPYRIGRPSMPAEAKTRARGAGYAGIQGHSIGPGGHSSSTDEKNILS